MVSSGASAALTLATAACIASANGSKPDQIPENVDRMKHEVIVQNIERSAAAIRDKIEAALSAFAQGTPAVDDITLLIVKREKQ